MIDKFKYTDKEFNEILSSIVILIDKQEKVNDHIKSYFDKRGVKYEIRKLKYGDYSFFIPQNDALNIPRDLYFDNEIIIERKNSLDEIAGNISRDRARLEKELALAPKHKVIMIEGDSYTNLLTGNYRSEYDRKSFWATLHSWWHRYDCPFFILDDKAGAGSFIRGYFTYYLREHLRKN